jgi:hypothetical protein
MIVRQYRCIPSSDDRDGHSINAHIGSFLVDQEDLAYKVELWDETGSRVEQVLAVTVSASLGYAAYFAATKDYGDRHITLRHKNRIVSRWNGPAQ